MDIIVTSVLGRVDGPSSVQLDSFTNISSYTDDTQQYAAHSMFGICSVMQDIIQFLYKGQNVDITSAQRFLKLLSQWKENLPEEINEYCQALGSPINPLEQAFVIGNIHLACVYYFAVILITRPFLISHMMMQLRSRDEQNPSANREVSKNEDVYRLAQACIDAAIYMAQICHDAVKSGLFLGNMCIIK